ncbi:hypothetical protein NG895_11035 [Aeoliella sp. ICT_H6.2]|uniref:Metallo-beta-lactamase superfamily protein n=1 Tax=Aeoliella straminimaris TaxID=2954799 RepID=A0A9X2JFU6_9BACT|nr:hypothetical protein [Aeoliella straminimaris]MCO6044440.1 hypothetical protein [Aeoliella straminimaris]
MPEDSKKPITSVKIRMYKMGTGDCISLKFLHGTEATYSMLIDCGCIHGSQDRLSKFVKELIRDLDGHVDALVVTHEHQDHVLGFQRCEDLLVEGLSVGEMWMGWTEDDGKAKVKEWKTEYGQKKMALARAAEQLESEVRSDRFAKQLDGTQAADELLAFYQNFADAVRGFAALHANEEPENYKGPLAGMRIAKQELARDHENSYLKPGDILYDIQGLDGVRIYVLGPLQTYEQVDKESGEGDEAYRHNKKLDPDEFSLNELRRRLQDSDLFTRTINFSGDVASDAALSPFSPSSFAPRSVLKKSPYEKEDEAWRRIDAEWLQSSASLALRMNSLTNNLSLVLAIEFEESGKILLFPGDAEFGSWESWHTIDWSRTEPGSELTTEEILNRVVFYKVAHHLSHNGTARSIGLEMMNDPNLVAMATLNYEVISSGWTSTMPNRAILKELLERTKGRTIIQNTDDLFFDLDLTIPVVDKIEEYQEEMTDDERQLYTDSVVDDDLYVEVTINV